MLENVLIKRLYQIIGFISMLLVRVDVRMLLREEVSMNADRIGGVDFLGECVVFEV